jgi:hypothetical protein
MQRKVTQQTGKFAARDANGDETTVIVLTHFTETTDLDGNVSRVPGIKALRTASGETVNRLEKGKYQILGESAVLTSDDPQAI